MKEWIGWEALPHGIGRVDAGLVLWIYFRCEWMSSNSLIMENGVVWCGFTDFWSGTGRLRLIRKTKWPKNGLSPWVKVHRSPSPEIWTKLSIPHPEQNSIGFHARRFGGPPALPLVPHHPASVLALQLRPPPSEVRCILHVAEMPPIFLYFAGQLSWSSSASPDRCRGLPPPHRTTCELNSSHFL